MFFLIFLLTKEILFAIATLLMMLWIVASEVHEGANKHGWKHEIVDTVISVAAILIFWFALQFILNTSTPVSAIVTCSMLPNLERGDMVIVQGTEINAYEIEMSREEFEKLKTFDSFVEYENENFTVKGSMYSYCKYNLDLKCNYFYLEPEKFVEKRGSLTFHYSQCGLNYLKEGITAPEPCITSVEYKGKDYPANLSHDVIVYIPEQGTYFSYIGDIIHRAYFKINVEDEVYYLTKGDNNPILDIQMYDYQYKLGNLPAKKVNGKKIFTIPYIGYLKLFISGFFSEDKQCNTLLNYDYLT